MDRLILHLAEVDRTKQERVGGKGFALAQLYRAGFAVPPGFVVTTDAYRAFARANGLDALVTIALADGSPTAIARLHAACRTAEIPPPVASAACTAYQALGGQVAVRSSATSEDQASASCAGQYATVLHVDGCAELLAALRHCWASLWTERVLSYHRQMGNRQHAAAMAVVVQQMVPAVQAGVAFTVDPITGLDDRRVVEAVAGQGEQLVSGRVTPHRYVVRPGEDPANVADELLDPARLGAVVDLAERVARWAGRPQDIEWALDAAGQLHLLQARPITTGISPSPSTIHWTRDNVGEILPNPVTPLSWSVLDPLGNRSFAAVLRRLGIGQAPSSRLLGHFYGRIYFNQTLFQATMARFYPSRVGRLAWPRLAWTAWRALVLTLRLPGEGHAVNATVRTAQRADRGLELASLPPAELELHIARWSYLSATAMEVHLLTTLIAELLVQALDKWLGRWGDGATGAAALTTGLTGIHSAEAGQALSVLARQIGEREELQRLVLSTPTDELPARLNESEAGRTWWAGLEAFLSTYGHAAAEEFELAAPRWRDNPLLLLATLQAQVRSATTSTADPVAARLAATASVERRYNAVQRWLFRRLLHTTQAFTIGRENLKYHFVVAHSRLRDLYLALATQLVQAGHLARPEDIFFLHADEIAALFEHRLSAAEASRHIDERRQVWQTHRQAAPPFAIRQSADGHPVPLPSSPLPGQDGPVLHGLPASPGVATGLARVVLTAEAGRHLQSGEVLVAPAVSPGWAPLLCTAGALVTEIGGVLSHGAIIAREYGLPAVLNVDNATRRIQTGQPISVDGTNGTVHLLENAP